MRKDLPLSTQAEINGHLIYTYPYSILCSSPVYKDYIMEHYLHCFVFVNESNDITFEYEDGVGYNNMYRCSGPFDIVYYPYSAGLQMNIEKTIVSAMEDNYYPVIFTDEYYLKSRPSYKKEHNLHEIMITGYDDKTFTYYAFNEKFRLSFSSFPRKNLRKAYRKGSRMIPNDAVSWVPGRSIILLKPRCALSEYEYSVARFRKGLEKYISAEPDPELRSFYIPNEKCFCGIKNTDLIKFALENSDKEIGIRYPAVHAWSESKKNMLSKISYYLEQTGYMDGDILDNYEKNVVRPAELIRMVVLKLRRNGRIDSADAIEHLNSITKSESELIRKILNLK